MRPWKPGITDISILLCEKLNHMHCLAMHVPDRHTDCPLDRQQFSCTDLAHLKLQNISDASSQNEYQNAYEWCTK